MKAIILSAGQGSRLLPLTADRPKCLIEFSGRTLLDWQLDALIANGIDDIVVVIGFNADLVEQHLSDRAEDRARIRTLFNPFFQVADNLGSLWLARPEMTGDFLVLNGDTLVSPDLVAKVLAEGNCPITVTVDQKPSYDADDMKVRRIGSQLVAIGKTLPSEAVNAESIGLLVFRDIGVEYFSQAIDRMMRTPEGTKSWYLKVVNRLAAETRIETVSIQGYEWGEVDFPADVVKGQALTAAWADPSLRQFELRRTA